MIARKVIAWQRKHGRHDLPWQNTRDAYAIWISEIMLQQTQVATVIPYYQRFMQRFGDVLAVANASIDDVLAHWSGLGYYVRARNIQRAAQVIRDVHAGLFPATFESIAALPGVGRSTAGAIMVFAYGGRHAILDGNVKRVLARCCGVTGYPGEKRVADALWTHAERLVPRSHVEAYTQGLMDLGATICLPRQPRCSACPLRKDCVAFRDQCVDRVPAPRPRKALPHRTTVMAVLEHAGALLLERRPAPGIWGGLWCFPEIGAGEDIESACLNRYGVQIGDMEQLPAVEHGFTHFSLTISPCRITVGSVELRALESEQQWFSIEQIARAAIPAPVKRIVESLKPV